MADKGGVNTERLPWLGPRLREARLRRQIPLSKLAADSGISRSYLHELETADPLERSVPTAAVLLRLAQQLGTSIGELVEENPRSLPTDDPDIPSGLAQAAEEAGLSESDVRRLAAIRFRGQQPQSVERWRLLIQQLELSEGLDGSRRP